MYLHCLNTSKNKFLFFLLFYLIFLLISCRYFLLLMIMQDTERHKLNFRGYFSAFCFKHNPIDKTENEYTLAIFITSC
jgi:hypothetical protein